MKVKNDKNQKLKIESFSIFYFLFSKFLLFIILFSIFYFLFSASVVSAAILYLEPSAGSYHQDDIFFVEIRLDTQGEYINAAEVKLAFPPDILEVEDFSQGNSILTLWLEKPQISSGMISFSGGIPGGYQGADGLIGRIIFKVKEGASSNAQIKFLDSSKVLLNDGLGAEAQLNVKGAIFNILAKTGEATNLWQEEIKKDKILPESFKIELSQYPNIFEGKYFITFSTTDKQTGIDHYEVKEGSGKWEIAVSPYVLKNQKLTSDIKVKAIDKAENYWMETLKAPNKSSAEQIIYIGLGITLILVIIITGRIVRKRKKKNYESEIKEN